MSGFKFIALTVTAAVMCGCASSGETGAPSAAREEKQTVTGSNIPRRASQTPEVKVLSKDAPQGAQDAKPGS